MHEELLNENRYESIKNVFKEKNIQISETDLLIYANVFEIISYFVNNKLTNTEMIEAYDLLSDLILNKRPDIRVYVEKKDRIRAQVALMDQIPFIKNKLDLEEKTMFAFCVFLGECVRTYDEEKGVIENGVVLFKSVEKVKEEFENYKSINPELFNLTLDNSANESKPDFGYSKNNPILTVSVSEAYNFLNRLRYKGKSVSYSRIGSVDGNAGHILDAYRITTTDGVLFSKKSTDYIIYIDSYSIHTSSTAPRPFQLF